MRKYKKNVLELCAQKEEHIYFGSDRFEQLAFTHGLPYSGPDPGRPKNLKSEPSLWRWISKLNEKGPDPGPLLLPLTLRFGQECQKLQWNMRRHVIKLSAPPNLPQKYKRKFQPAALYLDWQSHPHAAKSFVVLRGVSRVLRGVPPLKTGPKICPPL